MKVKAAVVVLSAVLFLAPQAVLAVPAHLNSFLQTYPDAANSKLDACTTCHTSPPALNPYGRAFGASGHNFAAIEPDDSDGDGFTNIQEIQALTFPGDPADVPQAPAPAPGQEPGPAPPQPPQPPAPAPPPVGLLHSDNFSDAGLRGDPDWEIVSGFWFGGETGAFESSVRGNSTAFLIGTPPITGFATGTIQADVSLSGGDSNLSILFDVADAQHFRFVRLEPAQVVVGQVGELAGTTPGVKFTLPLSLPIQETHTVRVRLFDMGRVSVSITNPAGNELIRPIGVTFSAPSPGRIGVQAQSKVLVDNFQVTE